MAQILLLTRSAVASVEVLPALGLLGHRIKVAEPGAAALTGDTPDVILLDARTELIAARTASSVIATAAPGVPVIAVFTEGGLIAVTQEWAVSDLVLDSAGPAEVDARIRLAIARAGGGGDAGGEPIQAGELVIEEDSYTARLHGRPLDLTYKEFELLKYLAQNPGRVYTRALLLQEVWGYDYFGGTRTVDVHVRRLRAKLGPEHESMIGTVRNVGYRFLAPASR